MKRTRNPAEKRRNIINATHKILRDGGYFTRFSLDAVAAEAGVSKGGLMHHFESKDALILAAARDAVEGFEEKIEQRLTADTNFESVTGKFTQAYIDTLLSPDRSNDIERLSPILLSYMRNLREAGDENTRFNVWNKHSQADGLDPVMAAIIRLATDGLLYTEMIDNQAIDEPLRSQILDRLNELASA